MMYYSPTLEAILPRWVFAYAGFTTFLYLTLDAIDGMQARKTQSSSPLGQLFDHGCDCCITTVFSLMMIHGLGLGSTVTAISLVAAVQVAFFLSQWEEKYTGICRTSVGGLFGVTESQMMLVGQMLLSAYDPTIGGMIVYRGYTFSNCFVAFYISFMVSISIACVIGIVTKHPKSVRELVSIVGLNILIVQWVRLGCVGKNEFAIVALSLAFCNSFSTVRVIVSSMSHTAFPLFQPVAYPLVGIVVCDLILGGGKWKLLALMAYFGALLDHIIKSLVQVTNEISAYLGIFVFTITQKRTQ
jgi:ethanolaminephosphotransferase